MKSNIASRLICEIQNVCPIVGASLDSSDRTTWRIDYRDDATPAQRAAAQAIVEAFDPNRPADEDYAVAIQAHVDATAKAKGYADGVAIAGYSTSTIPTWASEAATFIAWRDQVWLHAYTELAKVQAGQRQPPTVEGFISELPSIGWPI